MAVFSAHRYTLLSSPAPVSHQWLSIRPWSMISMLCLLLCIPASFYLGRLSTTISPSSTISDPVSASTLDYDSLPNLPVKTQTFTYQRLYGEKPSPDSDYAWLHLFPGRGGFFGHPTLATTRSTFSVFHQLHCLDGIRQGYWSLYAQVHNETDSGSTSPSHHPRDASDHLMMSSPPHIRHCIDLLRQTLMCNPDLTIEVRDDSVGGVKGFGTQRQCKDWKSLLKWTRNWQMYGLEEDRKGHENGVAPGNHQSSSQHMKA